MTLEQRVEALGKTIADMQEAARDQAAKLKKASEDAVISLAEHLKLTP